MPTPKRPEARVRAEPFFLLFSEATVPNTIHGSGVGVWGRKVNYMGCWFSPSTPTQGDVRGEKTDGSQDPILKLGGA